MEESNFGFASLPRIIFSFVLIAPEFKRNNKKRKTRQTEKIRKIFLSPTIRLAKLRGLIHFSKK